MLVLIDGDVLAYMACKQRSAPEGSFEEDAEYSPEEDYEYFEKSWGNFVSLVNDICDIHWSTEYLMAVKSAFNFRNLLYSDYKMNRHKDASKVNKFVPMIRKRAVEEGMAIEAFNCEADDFLRIWSEQAKAVEEGCVIVSIDKDLYCIPGLHYNPKKNESKTVSAFEAKRHFYEQLLKGDNVDNIPGIPNVGPKKAEKFLADCLNEFELQEQVVNAYLSHYEKDWYDQLLSNGKMLYLSKTYNDYFKISHWPVVSEMLEMTLQKQYAEPRLTATPKIATPKIVTPTVEQMTTTKKFKVPPKLVKV